MKILSSKKRPSAGHYSLPPVLHSSVHSYYCSLLILLLLVARDGVVYGEWDETSCDSIGITRNNINLECVNLCRPYPATEIFDGINTTDDGTVYQVLKCQCPDSAGCLDELKVLDLSEPVPTCDSVNINTIADCTLLCTDLEMQVAAGGFRDANGKTSCRCTDADICDDDPNCTQLRINPGTAGPDCANFCSRDGGPGGDAIATDEVDFASPTTVGNKDLTHLRVSCTCGAFEQCRQSILFSDLADIDSCGEDLGIISSDTCQEYCEQFGFVGDLSEYSNIGLSQNCTCSNEDGTTLACAESPGVTSSDPTETAPSASSDEGTIGDGIKATSTSGGATLLLSSPLQVFFMLASVAIMTLSLP